MLDDVYRVTSVNGGLDLVALSDGTVLARGLRLNQTNGQVTFTLTTASGNLCLGKEAEFVYDFDLFFGSEGSGSGKVHWTYGFNTNCFVCDKSDTAVLRRISGP